MRFLLALLAGPAMALSCAQPNFSDRVDWAVAADQTYALAVGTITWVGDPSPLETTTLLGETAQRADIRFRGEAFGLGPIDERMVSVQACLMGACGGLPQGVEVALFLRLAPEGLVAEFGVCPDWLERPSPQEIDMLRTCVRNEGCPPAIARHFTNRRY